jgi:hypothetical protein
MEGYEVERCIKEHPFGTMYLIHSKDNDYFKKCMIDNTIDQQLFKNIHSLANTSYIVSYESNDNELILEKVFPIEQTLNTNEIKNIIISMFEAIKILQSHNISLEYIDISQIYTNNNRYKLDCYCIGNKDYKELVQDVCNIGLNIIDNDNRSMQRVLKQYANIKYQISIDKMIEKINNINVKNKTYTLTNKNINYRKNSYITKELIFYLIDNYRIIILIIFFIILLIII